MKVVVDVESAPNVTYIIIFFRIGMHERKFSGKEGIAKRKL